MNLQQEVIPRGSSLKNNSAFKLVYPSPPPRKQGQAAASPGITLVGDVQIIRCFKCYNQHFNLHLEANRKPTKGL